MARRAQPSAHDGERVSPKARTEVALRDAFLSRVASAWSASVSELERAARATAKLPAPVTSAVRGLQETARELRIIACPREPVQLRLHKRELCDWLARFCDQRQAQAEQRGLQIQFEHAGTLHCRIDDDLLATMLLELLSNALKYRRRRPVTLHAACSGKTVALSVTNHGAWIGPKPTYKRFARGESRRAVQGYGVGLWLTRRLALAHGGRFTIASDPTHTRAIIRLPAVTHRGKPAWFRATIHKKP